jgi:uncharacterized protein
MDLSHQFRVPVPVEEAWAHFNDITSVAECFPGATVSSADGDTFSGSVKVKLGPVALVYNGSGTFIEKDETTHRFVVEAKGKDKRGNGTAGAMVTLTMADAGGSTDVEVLTDLSITGKPAQFGRGVMQDVSDKLLGQFVDCLEGRFGAPAAAPATPQPQTAAPPEGPDEARGPGAGLPPSPTPPGVAAPAATDDSLDLGATVLPVLVKSYWKQGLAALAAIVLLVWILRRG